MARDSQAFSPLAEADELRLVAQQRFLGEEPENLRK